MSILPRNKIKPKSGEQLRQELLGQIRWISVTDHSRRPLEDIPSHPDAQKQVREEVTTVHAQGDLSYAELASRYHLLRDVANVDTLPSRSHSAHAVVPLQRAIKGKSRKTYTSVQIPANTDICVGIIGANKGKAIWGTHLGPVREVALGSKFAEL
ncbi:hypothetical protein B0H11DRAFT_2431755 [Mycena galericulata]|nr:hypothetical protein B0H11DRAFT_2431755 [Mycena galericulata]